MTIYAVFDRDMQSAPAVVADRFSWFAALLPPLFAIVHGLWLELLGFILVAMLLGAASNLIGDGTAFWIYVVFAVWIGFESATLRRAALRRRGWRYRTEVVAGAPDLAELEGIKSRP